MQVEFVTDDASSRHFGRHACYSETTTPQQIVLAENKKSGALKLFCGSQKAIVLPQQDSTSHSERERIDLSFTVSQQ